MAAVDLRVDLSTLIDAIVEAGQPQGSNRSEAPTQRNISQLIATARDYLHQDKAADVLIGRIGMIAAHGDTDGHPTITLDSASMLARLAYWIPAPIDTQDTPKERTLPLLVQALKVAAPYVRQGLEAHTTQKYPSPFFPSELMDTGKSVNDIMRDAVAKSDALLVERALLGLYGTGADYRTMQVRAYESISNTFQGNGHPLMFAVRGFQLLDAVEWGNHAPNIIHWLAPHLPLRLDTDEPPWIKTVRTFAAEPKHDLTVIRTRLSASKEENALPLRNIILSDTDTAQVCQRVYDALVTNGASAIGVASVISLAAADVLQRVGESDYETFIHVAHGLLFTSAVHVIFQQVRDVEVLNLLYTAASAINALHKEVPTEGVKTPQMASKHIGAMGGGLLAISLLETLGAEIKAQDIAAAASTAQRYLKLGHDPRALFGTIGLAAALVDATAEQGHTLQIVQAASDAFLNWPRALVNTNVEAFVQIALRAAITGKRDTVVAELS
jgi:hypothetical protein